MKYLFILPELLSVLSFSRQVTGEQAYLKPGEVYLLHPG